MTWRLHRGDCLDLLRSLDEASVDAIVCDPPYGLGFMGKAWDALPPGREWAAECLRVLKPGGHLVAFGGTRTVHRLACAVEDAGFEIRDLVGWFTAQGFPKSLDVSKAIDAAAGAERRVIGIKRHARDGDVSAQAWATAERGEPLAMAGSLGKGCGLDTAPATDAARQHAGKGTALKPAIEPAVLARKPLDGTVAANVLRHGTGALNIDATRFTPGDPAWVGPSEAVSTEPSDPLRFKAFKEQDGVQRKTFSASPPRPDDLGRWPANVYHCPKASRSERERGCDGLPARSGAEAVDREPGSPGMQSPRAGAGRKRAEVRNHHCTVKPVRLMRWLCRLVTPPGGLVLDPFSGSGSCGVAAVLEGFRYLGAELEPDYAAIAEARIAHAVAQPDAWKATAPGFGVKRRKVAEVVPLRTAEPVRPQLVLFGGAR